MKESLNAISKPNRWSMLVLIGLGVFLFFLFAKVAGLSNLDIGNAAVYFFGFLFLAGFSISICLTESLVSSILLALPIGIALNMASFSVGNAIQAPLLVAATVTFLVILTAFPKIKRLHFDIDFKDVGAVSVLTFLLLLYRHSIMHFGNHLPNGPEDPARIWLDVSYFLGHIASLKQNPLFPHDFHILHTSIRYHHLYFLLSAFPSKLFSTETFDLLTAATPIFVSWTLVTNVYFFSKKLTGSCLKGILGCLFTIFSAYAFYRYAFEAQLDLTLNFYTSPSNLLGFALACPVLMNLFDQNRLRLRLDPLLIFLWIFLVGSKISVAAILLGGLSITVASDILSRKEKSFSFAVVASCFIGFALGYLLFFFRLDTGGVASGAAFALHNNVLEAVSKNFPEIHLALASSWINKNFNFFGRVITLSLGLILRHLPVAVTLLIVWLHKSIGKNSSSHLDRRSETILFKVGLGGLVIALFINVHEDTILHFYHAALFLLGLGTVGLLRNRSLKLGHYVIIGIAAIASALPLIADGRVEFLNGFSTSGKALVAPADLDWDLLQIFKDIRAKSAPEDVVLSGNVNLREKENEQRHAFNFMASAFTERQVFLEGYEFSFFASGGRAEHIQVLEEQMMNFYRSKDSETARQILLKIQAQWIVWDTRIHGSVPIWAKKIMKPEMISGPVYSFSRMPHAR